MRLVFLAVLSTAAAMLAGAALPVARSADTGTNPAHSISVTASGTVQAVPDVAYITVGVQSTNLEAAVAQNTANGVTAKAIAALKALGIQNGDIQTAGISLTPLYDDHNVLTGFQASDTLAITIRHLKQTGPAIDAAVRAGANQGLSVSFGLQDSSTAEASALRAAVADAQRKAAVVATQMGVSLTGAQFQVTEEAAVQPQPVVQLSRVAAPALANATPVQAGSLTIQDSVTVTYTF